MRLENKTSEMELIAKAFQAISREISYEALAKAILNAALGVVPASRERIFDAPCTAKADGLGTGPSIRCKFDPDHGGRLWEEDNTTHGVTFTLPARQSLKMSRSQ